MTTRRNFITLLSGAAAGWPLAARAQQPALIAVLIAGSEAAYRRDLESFRGGMRLDIKLQLPKATTPPLPRAGAPSRKPLIIAFIGRGEALGIQSQRADDLNYFPTTLVMKSQAANGRWFDARTQSEAAGFGQACRSEP